MVDWNNRWEHECARATISLLWREYGITYRPITWIVFEMALEPDTIYSDVLEAVAQYAADQEGFPDWSASRWNSEICYHLLKKVDIDTSAEEWMRERAEEVRAIASGISA